MSKVEYNSNNSGGHWWLTDENWRDLEIAGWIVKWGRDYYCHSRFQSSNGPRPSDLVECESSDACEGHRSVSTYEDAVAHNRRFLGALATGAVREGLPLREAVDEWERVTGLSSTDAGCACCGQPHTFTEYDDAGKRVASGPSASYEARWS